jgi:hypothetical protein
MSEDNELHINSEITRHFKLLRTATYAFGSLITLSLIPLVTLIWSMKSEQILIRESKIDKTEVYDNFVNKGQYIYLEGERIKCHENIKLGKDESKTLSEWGKQVKDALDLRYRGGE